MALERGRAPVGTRSYARGRPLYLLRMRQALCAFGKKAECRGEKLLQKCGRTKAVENAGRRLRQRRAEARRLYESDGKSPAAIAKLLNVRKPETVRGWIEKGKGDGKTKTRKR